MQNSQIEMFWHFYSYTRDLCKLSRASTCGKWSLNVRVCRDLIVWKAIYHNASERLTSDTQYKDGINQCVFLISDQKADRWYKAMRRSSWVLVEVVLRESLITTTHRFTLIWMKLNWMFCAALTAGGHCAY